MVRGSLLVVVRALVALQARLLARLGERVEVDSREFFNGVAPGDLLLDDVRWQYRFHGRGVTFTDGRRVVTVNRAPHLPWAFDAWRVSQFVESACSPAELDSIGDVASRLEELHREQRLVRVEVDALPGEPLFRLAEDGAQGEHEEADTEDEGTRT